MQSKQGVHASISWVHIGDLHMDDTCNWSSRGRLDTIVAELNDHIGDAADFVFLPGDNANDALPDQYAHIVAGLAPLRNEWRVIPGDHDFAFRNLANYDAAFAIENRPEVEVIADHRCIFLDIVSAGAGGPDFRLTRHDRNRLIAELARARADRQTAIVFMHAYPGDLAADGDEIAAILADGGAAFVDTGHTHYSELLNDGRVVYGATRSTGQIEEGNERPGYSIVTIHDTVPSWRFKEVDTSWPFVQIVAPADLRMVTRPTDPRQVPRPGPVTVTAKVFGAASAATLHTDDAEHGMIRDPNSGLWTVSVSLDAGLHTLSVTAGADRDTIRVLVRGADDIPRREPAIALGTEVHAIGAWPEHGLEGTQLGPNKNGRHW